MTTSKGNLQVVEKQKTLMEVMLENFEPKKFPTKMDLWRIVVQVPQPPTHTAGGIALPDDYLQRFEFANYIGYVLDMGPLCYKAVTRSGLKLEEARKCQVGDWVHFGKHDGEKFRTEDGTLFVVMADTQVIGVVEEPEKFDCMIA